MGEPIIKQGQIINEISVLSEGKCKVVYETIHSRTLEPSNKIKGMRRPLRNMNFYHKNGLKPINNPKQFYPIELKNAEIYNVQDISDYIKPIEIDMKKVQKLDDFKSPNMTIGTNEIHIENALKKPEKKQSNVQRNFTFSELDKNFEEVLQDQFINSNNRENIKNVYNQIKEAPRVAYYDHVIFFESQLSLVYYNLSFRKFLIKNRLSLRGCQEDLLLA